MKPLLKLLRLPLDFIFLTIDWFRCFPEFFFKFTAKNVSCPFCLIGRVDTSSKDRPCIAAHKYGNLWLFKSVCSCASAPDATHEQPWCKRRDPYSRRLIHLPLTGLMLFAAWMGIGIGCAELSGKPVLDNFARLAKGESFFLKVSDDPEIAPRASTASGDSTTESERAAKAMAKGLVFFEKGDYANARISFLNARQADPANVEARYRIGICQMRMGETASALNSLKAAVERDPTHLDARLALAQLYQGQLKYSEALDHALVAREKQPEDPEIAILLLKAYEGLRRYADADSEVERIMLSTNATDWVVAAEYQLRRGKSAEAIDLFDQVLAQDATNRVAHYALAEALIREADLDRAQEVIASARGISSNALEVAVLDAQLLIAQGETKAGLNAYRTLVKANPHADGIAIRLASLLSRSGELDECRKLVQALEHSRDAKIATQAQQLLAQMFYSRGMLPEAEHYSDKILRADPHHVESLLTKAQVEAQRKRVPEAMKLVERALVIQPDHVVALNLKARGLMLQKDSDGASVVYRRLADLLPENPQPLGLLAQLQFQAGKFSECIESCTEALKRDAAAPIAANRRALAYVELGEVDKAFASIAPIYALVPKSGYIADAYGWALLQQGKSAEALQILELASTQLRGPLISYHLGAAYVRAGESDKARVALGQALQLSETFPGIDQVRKLLSEL